jgi:hypothetical protein
MAATNSVTSLITRFAGWPPITTYTGPSVSAIGLRQKSMDRAAVKRQ